MTKSDVRVLTIRLVVPYQLLGKMYTHFNHEVLQVGLETLAFTDRPITMREFEMIRGETHENRTQREHT